jgi:hypothetical protein
MSWFEYLTQVAVLVDQTTLPTADELPEPLWFLPRLPAGGSTSATAIENFEDYPPRKVDA